MPKYVKVFLGGLTPKQKDAVWSWLDGDPDAIEQMIRLVGTPSGKPNVPRKRAN